MTLFLLAFFFLYGLLHAYAFLKLRAAFPLGVATSLGIAAFMFAMVTAPGIVRLAEKTGFELIARMLSWVGYSWMGILFLFVVCSILVDLYRLCIVGVELFVRRDLTPLLVSSRRAFLLAGVASLAIALYGAFEAMNVRLEKITVRTPKITLETGPVRIAQISDVHLGLIVREDRLRRILDEVAKAEPDVLVSTGDLVDGQIDNLSLLAEMLRAIDPPYGKYAITGNHEFYAGIEQATRFAEQAGFRLLRGEWVDVGGVLAIAGIDDVQARAFGLYRGKPEEELLAEVPRERFIVLLKHRPIVEGRSHGRFDLQLSGHTHKGQIFPFSIITGLYFVRQAGFVPLPNGSALYVSRGSGTWGPPIRFLSPPEVTLIELVPEDVREERPS